MDLDEVVVTTRGARSFGAAGGGESHFRDFNEVVQGAEKIDGLFTLHQKGDHLYAEIRNDQFDQPLLAADHHRPRHGPGRHAVCNFGDDMVLVFKRVGDKVQLIRRNIHYKASSGSPLEKAVKQNYIDSILMSLPIVSDQPGRRRRGPDRPLRHLPRPTSPSSASAASTAAGRLAQGQGVPEQPRARGRGDLQRRPVRPVRDGRRRRAPTTAAITLVVHYSLVKAPDGGYHPRMADDRVGHFLDASKDFGKADPDTNFVRQINRWRLEKADPKAKLSPPKKQIVWYIEDTVPIEYRPYVEDGHPRVEQGVREDRLPRRHRRPLAGGGPRRLRPRGHQLLHLPLGHQRQRLRHVVPAGQPADRRDDRRRRHLRRRASSATGSRSTPCWSAPSESATGDRRAGAAGRGRGHQPDPGRRRWATACPTTSSSAGPTPPRTSRAGRSSRRSPPRWARSSGSSAASVPTRSTASAASTAA